MQTPKRKPGKYTNSEKDPHITAEKFDELKKNLEKLKKAVRPKLISEVQRLALLGDFSENAEYQIAKGKLRGINRKIIEIETLLSRAVIIKTDPTKQIVQIGSKVLVQINGIKQEFTILGSEETDPLSGVISQNSPIGSALLNHKIGNIVKIYIKDKEIECKIIKIF